MNIHEAKSMGDVMTLALKVNSRASAKKFLMEYLESAPDLTEEKIIENLKFGFSRHFDGSDPINVEMYRYYMALFT